MLSDEVTAIESHSKNVFHDTQTLCGNRQIRPKIIPSRINNVNNNRNAHDDKKNILVVIGHDKMNHVQTNNRVNAIFHAMDYAHDINATLALTRGGWPVKTLKLLFYHDYNKSTLTRSSRNHDDAAWENSIETNLNIKFVNDNAHDAAYSKVYFNNSDDMYYYHTNASLETIKQRRDPILQYLWTHPTVNEGNDTEEEEADDDDDDDDNNNDMCSVVRKTVSMHNSSYTVIHSRWMKNNGCLNRMGALSHRIRERTGVSMDRKAPCLLTPRYIESIVNRCGLLGKPIYIISDELNPNLVEDLQLDPTIGKDIRVISSMMKNTTATKAKTATTSWVGGDMMLAVLSDCFIGTPVSTLSGNIARARIALGKDPFTNFLFPEKKNKKDEVWTFSCQNNSDYCLYDARVLSHYVG